MQHGFLLTKTQQIRKDRMNQFFHSEQEMNELDARMNEFLNQQKAFLQQKYSLVSLSRDINVPIHCLSAFINIHYKMRFTDFINSYRVRHSKQMIIDGECKYKKLEAISFESGFNNRNTFTTAFKKETGQSPSEFLKMIASSQFGEVSIPHENRRA